MHSHGFYNGRCFYFSKIVNLYRLKINNLNVFKTFKSYPYTYIKINGSHLSIIKLMFELKSNFNKTITVKNNVKNLIKRRIEIMKCKI